jgi:hypothetical protein
MSVSKDVIKQCLISKQREVDEATSVLETTLRTTGC